MESLLALGQYDDDDSPKQAPVSPPAKGKGKGKAAPAAPAMVLPLVVAAPEVTTTELEKPVWKDGYNDTVVVNNPKIDKLFAPLQGPIHPQIKGGLEKGMANHRLGSTETLIMGHQTFDSQFNNFNQESRTLQVNEFDIVTDKLKEAAPAKKRKLTGDFAGFETNVDVSGEVQARVAARKKEVDDEAKQAAEDALAVEEEG